MVVVAVSIITVIAALAAYFYLNKKNEKLFKKYKLPLLVAAVSNIFVVLIFATSLDSDKIVEVERPDTSESTKNMDAYAVYGEEEYPVDIVVSPKKYTYEQIQEVFDETYDIIVSRITADGDTTEHVTENLNLMDSISETGITVEWEVPDNDIIDYQGRIIAENLDKNGVDIILSVNLIYEEYQGAYTINLIFYPKEYTREELVQKEIQNAVDEADKNGDEEKIVLPKELDGIKLNFFQQENDSYKYLGLLGIIAAVMILFAGEKEKKKELEQRHKELDLQYSELVAKLTLLTGAGMTVFGSWEKIVQDYNESKKLPSFQKKLIYEEMSVTYFQMKSGISEVNAYEEFGKRCNTQMYLQFGTLLSQNIRKGTANLLQLLDSAANEAFNHRRQLAKKQGEEASTKLLLPMIMMLGIVMIIVMFPAFVSFGI